MNNDPENDEVRQKVDEDGLLEDLADEFTNGDPDDGLARAEELGYDIDDLPRTLKTLCRPSAKIMHSGNYCRDLLSGAIIKTTTE